MLIFIQLLFFIAQIGAATEPRGPRPQYSISANPDAISTVGEKKPINISVSAERWPEFQEEDLVKIWEVYPRGKKIRLLGIAGKMKCANNKTGRCLVWKVEDFPSAWKKYPQAEGAAYIKATIRSASGKTEETNIKKIPYYDSAKMWRELNSCNKNIERLLNAVPKRIFTDAQCKEEGGRVESPGLLCGVGSPGPKQICKNGVPLGSVSGMMCDCFCCK